jgi:probable rRNA maturation factor
LVILRKPIAGLSEVALARFVAKAIRIVRLKGEVHVLVTGSHELRRLNRSYRRKDKPTDVLSFPAVSDLSAGVAGDVAISAEIAAKNAQQLGHSTAQEIKILALHGLLHLAGYDHERDHGEMARKELHLRKSFGLPVGLIERSGQSQKPLTAEGAKAAQRTLRKPGATHARTIQ